MPPKIVLLVMMLAFATQAQARTPFSPETAQLIKQLFGKEAIKQVMAGKKTLRMKFAKESLWTFKTIRNNCQRNFLACPKRTVVKQILTQCQNNKKQCLKYRFAARKRAGEILADTIPISFSNSGTPTVKILFKKKHNKKKRFHNTRLIIIHETLTGHNKTSNARVLMDATMTDLHFVSTRLPEIKLQTLCKNPLNLVTVLLKTTNTLFYTNRAYIVRIACEQ